jgi:hypothetical protein
MQVTLKNRETLSGVVTIATVPFDTNGMSLITLMLTVYAISGTTPDIEIQLQTSNDLETWVDVGASFSRTTAGTTITGFDAATVFYQRYVRAQIALTGTGPLASYSLWANLFSGT